MAEIPYDLLGLIFGILGIVGLIPLLWAAVRYQLPHHKLRQLDATLEETNSLLESAIRDGLVPSVEFVLEMRHLLRLSSQDHTEMLRPQVLCAEDFRSQFSATMRGLSRKVDSICRRVKAVRNRILRTSQEERRKATEIGQEQERSVVAETFSQGLDASFTSAVFNDETSTHDALDYNMTTNALPDKLIFQPATLAKPPPTYDSNTPDVMYQPVRHRSNSSETSFSWTHLSSFPETPAPSTGWNVPPPYSGRRLSHDGPSVRSSFLPSVGCTHPEPLSTPVTERDNVGNVAMSDLQGTHALLAELREHSLILEGLQTHILSLQTAVERTLHSRSHSSSVSSDVETGMRSIDSYPIPPLAVDL